MPRKKMTEQEKRRRELVRELLKETPVRDGQDLNNIMKEIIAEIVKRNRVCFKFRVFSKTE